VGGGQGVLAVEKKEKGVAKKRIKMSAVREKIEKKGKRADGKVGGKGEERTNVL